VVLKRDSISNCNASDENGQILVPVSKAAGLIPQTLFGKMTDVTIVPYLGFLYYIFRE
jgi:hypothetical protein